ncbi:MAG TPA: hypothetical protein VFS88_09330 [Micavibrio sp.]|nr:hypothetical protein [Micavibrio sp.]
MSSLKYALAGAALLYVSGDVAAESPALKTSSMNAVSVMGFKGSRFQNYVLEETVRRDHTASRGRVYVDRDIGIICEWKEKGRAKRDSLGVVYIVGRKGEAIGCKAGTAVPKKWDEMEVEDFFAEGRPQQDPKNFSVIHDVIMARDIKGNPQFQISHSWNISANKVCLKTVEVLEDDVGDQSVFSHEWGCFDIQNKARLDQVLKSVRIIPS